MLLERKLPLMVTAVLVAILGSAVALAYREVRHAGLEGASLRLTNVAGQLSQLAGASITQHGRTMREVAGAPAVRSYILAHGSGDSTKLRAAADSQLRRLRLPGDSTLAIQLWSPEGTLLTALGDPPATRIATGREESGSVNDAPPLGGSHRSTRVPAGSDTLALSRFFEGQDHAVYYWVTLPVLASDRTVLGWIAQQARIRAQPGSERRLDQLVGEHTTVYFRNAGDDFWTTLAGTVTKPPAAEDEAPSALEHATSVATGSEAPIRTYMRPGHGTVLAVQSAVRGTPWIVVVEQDRAAILAPARAVVLRFGALCLALLALGAFAAWAMIRRAVRPLTGLAEAATSFASGDYAVRAVEREDDEVGQLARTFNRMASDVERSDAELRLQVQSAQQLARELEQARIVALGASHAKSNFLATMSHEIRTPINAIVGYTDLLELEIAGPLAPGQRAHLHRIQTSARHLLSLVNNVLDLARIEAGTTDLQSAPCNVRAAIDDALILVRPQASTKGIALTFEPPSHAASTCIADERAMRQILANLFSNAVKFTPSGGRITVRCDDATPPRDADILPGDRRYVAIRVIDTGVGMSESDQARIFRPFTQLETERRSPYTRSQGGAGLGLSISRQLAHLIAGDITVESAPGRGSTFTLWIPAATVVSESPELRRIMDERTAFA
jgi:signal transduction histidine kinase